MTTQLHIRRSTGTPERGAAIIAAMLAIALLISMLVSFGRATTTDITAAANYRDAMRAHFLARSALNLSELIIRVQQRLDNVKMLGGVQITDFADQILMAFCGGAQEIGLSAEDGKGLGAEVGTCGVVKAMVGAEPGAPGIGTDDGKINVNCANGSDAAAANLKSKLDALMYFPAYDAVFQEADAEGWQRTREMQVAAIIDYIDSNTMVLRERGTSESYNYEGLQDRYQAKNNYLDSIEELKLVRGVDDRFWSLFGEAFTIYGSCKTNIAATDNAQLLASILYLSAANPNDPVLRNPSKLWLLAGLVIKARGFGMNFASTDDLIKFVRNPSELFSGLMSSGASGGKAPPLQLPGLAPGETLGLELDKTKLDQIATAGARRSYRVYAWGAIESAQQDKNCSPLSTIRRTIEAVWDTKVVNQNARNPDTRSGSWVFLKEE